MSRKNKINANGEVALGSTANRVMLAIRAANGPESAKNIQAWLPFCDLGSVSGAIFRLREKRLVALVNVKNGTSYYDLTEAGRALVHPKTGPLSLRRIASDTPLRGVCNG